MAVQNRGGEFSAAGSWARRVMGHTWRMKLLIRFAFIMAASLLVASCSSTVETTSQREVARTTVETVEEPTGEEPADAERVDEGATPAAVGAAEEPMVAATASTEQASQQPVELAQPEGLPRYRGINLAGAEFGDHTLPGTYDVEYTYPTAEEVDFFIAQGMNVFRLPFKWERLQPSTFAPFDSAEAGRIAEFVSHATARGAAVVLDPHNYAYYYDDVIGSSAVEIAAYVDLWTKLAASYQDNDQVFFGLMNEPIDIDSDVWFVAANAAIAGIREVGAPNLVLVPGNYYSGAHSWTSDNNGLPNSDGLLRIVDPLDNFVVEVHQYLDSDSSGTSGLCVNDGVGSKRLEDFTDWLYDNELQGFLGEFGAGDGRTCLSALDDMLDFVDEHSEVWLGWTYWAAGPWWGDYIFEVHPDGGLANDPQLEILTLHTN